MIKCVFSVMEMWKLFILLFIPLVYGTITNAQVACSEHCLPVGDAVTCNTTNGVCTFGCVLGYTGDTCNTTCSPDCLNCTLTSGNLEIECQKCNASFYRRNGACVPCNSGCLRNESSTLPVCREDDGTCEFGCNVRNFGRLCNKPCSATCMKNLCTRESGSCIEGCSLNLFTGVNCRAYCSSGCVGGTCEQSGNCKQGCMPGTWGPSCEPCTSSCANATDRNTQQLCNVTDGTCLFGCNSGTWGPSCELQCPENCSSAESLPSCAGPSGQCGSCAKGWFGDFCNMTCSQDCVDVCDQNDGACECRDGATASQCNSVPQGAPKEETDSEGAQLLPVVLIVLGLLFVVISVVFFIYLVRRD